MSTALLKKIAVVIEKKQDSLFTYPVEKQKKYVGHFPEPKDGFERGYFQYCCQMKLYGQPLYTVLNLVALPVALNYSLRFQRNSAEKQESMDAVFFTDGKPFNILPDSLIARYAKITTPSADERALNKADVVFLKGVYKRYPFSWMLWLKLILKIAQYSHAISVYSPKAIVSCSEYSFTAPILTEYCHMHGVKLINVMHGEKLYDMKDTFSKFDEFYVWSQEYVDLLCELRGDRKQFRIEIPQSLRLKKDGNIQQRFDYTYYLAAESEEVLLRIAEALQKLNAKGGRISVRPHPRYSNMADVKKYFGFANIEDTETVTIEQSLLQTGAAVSLFSTVLNQAQCNEISIVIDDISNHEHFSKLRELKYVCLDKEHRLLSELV